MPVEPVVVLDEYGKKDPIMSVDGRLMSARVILFAALAVDRMAEARADRRGVQASIGRLVVRLGTARGTVQQALAGLEAMGWIRPYRRTAQGVAVFHLAVVDADVVAGHTAAVEALRTGLGNDDLARTLAAVTHPTWQVPGWPRGGWTTEVARLAGLPRPQALLPGAGHNRKKATDVLAELTAAGWCDLVTGLDHHEAAAAAAERAASAMASYDAAMKADRDRMAARRDVLAGAAEMLSGRMGEAALLPPNAGETARREWAVAVRTRFRMSGQPLDQMAQRGLAEVIKARLTSAGEPAEVAARVGLRIVGLDEMAAAA